MMLAPPAKKRFPHQAADPARLADVRSRARQLRLSQERIAIDANVSKGTAIRFRAPSEVVSTRALDLIEPMVAETEIHEAIRLIGLPHVLAALKDKKILP